MVNDLNDRIIRLKSIGMSIRSIAREVGLSHVAVLKRLKTIGEDKKATSIEGDDRLPLVTRKNPYLTINHDINLSEKCILKGKKGEKEVFSDTNDGLIGIIRDFLKEKDIEVYRMDTEPEAYQVKYKGQIIRFYVQREKVNE